MFAPGGSKSSAPIQLIKTLCRPQQPLHVIKHGSQNLGSSIMEIRTAVAISFCLSLCSAACKLQDYSENAEAQIAATKTCSELDPKSISDKARSFMKKKQMIKSGDELKDEFFQTRWNAIRIEEYGGKCLVIMNLQNIMVDLDIAENGQAVDLIIADLNDSMINFQNLSEVFSWPKDMIMGIGSLTLGENSSGETPTSLRSDLYYVSMTGDSLEQAIKSVIAKYPACGFSAKIDASSDKLPTGKYDFDPTSHRTWKVIQAEFDLRRGHTAEIHDVNAAHLDQDFLGYLQGSAGHVAPWGDCFIRTMLIDGTWTKLYQETNIKSQSDVIPQVPPEIAKIVKLK